MMYHIRQLFILGCLLGAMVLIFYPCIQDAQPQPPKVESNTMQEISPQEFESLHLRPFDQRPLGIR